MALTSISVILTVFVLKLHHCEPHQRALPTWVRCCVIEKLGAVVKCEYQVKRKKRRKNNRKNGGTHSAEVNVRLMNEVHHHHSDVISNSNMANHEMVTSSTTRTFDTTMTSPLSDHPALNECVVNMRRLRVLEDILRQLKIMVDKREEDDMEDDVMNEWRQVAQIVDRTLFIFFLSCTIFTTLILMVIIPINVP